MKEGDRKVRRFLGEVIDERGPGFPVVAMPFEE
jgi:hypothetical protein